MHYQVVNKKGELIESAVTNLDLHDIARAAKTFAVNCFYVVTPLTDQIDLSKRIISHWVEGAGGDYNPKRREALKLIRIKSTLAAVKDDIVEHSGSPPKTIVTTAKSRSPQIQFDGLRRMIHGGDTCLLILGTAWGLSEEIMAEADFILEPIAGCSDYNHLSVRSATAIMLDQLLGRGPN